MKKNWGKKLLLLCPRSTSSYFARKLKVFSSGPQEILTWEWGGVECFLGNWCNLIAGYSKSAAFFTSIQGNNSGQHLAFRRLFVEELSLKNLRRLFIRVLYGRKEGLA